MSNMQLNLDLLKKSGMEYEDISTRGDKVLRGDGANWHRVDFTQDPKLSMWLQKQFWISLNAPTGQDGMWSAFCFENKFHATDTNPMQCIAEVALEVLNDSDK